MSTYLITGANRGLGLEFARQLTDAGHAVIGTARDLSTADELQDVADRVELCDATHDESVRRLGASLDGTAIDVLINNAGVSPERGTIEEIGVDRLEAVVQANAIGPVRVTQALLPHLRRGEGKRIINITSNLGSIERAGEGGYISYRAAKAALNMLNRCMAHDLGKEGFVCLALHPGWVRTRMGGPDAPTSPEESIRGMIQVIDALTPEQNGAYMDYRGEHLPW